MWPKMSAHRKCRIYAFRKHVLMYIQVHLIAWKDEFLWCVEWQVQEAQLLLTHLMFVVFHIMCSLWWEDDLHFTSPEGSSDARRIPSIAYLRHSISHPQWVGSDQAVGFVFGTGTREWLSCNLVKVVRWLTRSLALNTTWQTGGQPRRHGDSRGRLKPHFVKRCTSDCAVQVIIFVKSIQRCVALSALLVEQNFPAIGIHKAMTQDQRLVAPSHC